MVNANEPMQKRPCQKKIGLSLAADRSERWVVTRLLNALMLNCRLNMKSYCSRKRIKNRRVSCNSLWIPTFVSSESILIMSY